VFSGTDGDRPPRSATSLRFAIPRARTKFSPPYRFWPDDAKKAFQIVLDILRYVSEHEHGFEVINTRSPHFVFDLKSADFDAVSILKQKTGG
jgi:hypothetical protein